MQGWTGTNKPQEERHIYEETPYIGIVESQGFLKFVEIPLSFKICVYI
jgi:hypothetical protein